MTSEQQLQTVEAIERHLESITFILNAVREGKMEISDLQGGRTVGYGRLASGSQSIWLKMEVQTIGQKPPRLVGDPP